MNDSQFKGFQFRWSRRLLLPVLVLFSAFHHLLSCSFKEGTWTAKEKRGSHFRKSVRLVFLTHLFGSHLSGHFLDLIFLTKLECYETWKWKSAMLASPYHTFHFPSK